MSSMLYSMIHGGTGATYWRTRHDLNSDLPSLSRPFNDGWLALQVADGSEAFEFVRFAEALARAYDGEVLTRLTGLDEAYWDIRVRGQLLTLHYQHYLGTFLCATDESSERLLAELVVFAASFRRDTSGS